MLGCKVEMFVRPNTIITGASQVVLVVKKVKVKVSQLFPTLCDPMDYTVHGILWARIVEWIAFPFSRRSSQPRDWTQVSSIAGGFFPNWAFKNPPTNAGDIRDTSSIPDSGRSPGGGHGNSLQYSYWKDLMDRGVWWATVHGVSKSLKQLSTILF